MATRLSVNVNKIATLRNARGKNTPNVLESTLAILSYGAEGITVHPRPDGRHIRHDDVDEIARHIHVELNIEGYPSRDFLDLIKKIKPAQCTLVPDPPEVITSNAGWAIAHNAPFLKETVAKLHSYGVRTSLFIDPMTISVKEINDLKTIGTDRVELYTEAYADSFGTDNANNILDKYKHVAMAVHELGIDLNAGHDLNLQNLRQFITEIPIIKEVSIGHALICDALSFGLKETIKRYLGCLQIIPF